MDTFDFFLYITEIIGTLSFAATGAMVALEEELDLFGVVLLGVTTAMGGGCVRDLMLGNLPPRMFSNYEFLLMAAGLSLFIFCLAFWKQNSFYKNRIRIDSINNVFDAIGLGAFTVIGVQAAVSAQFGGNGVLAVFLGMMTGCGGGVLRDVLCGRIPVVLNKRIYAVASLAGGTVFYILERAGVGDGIAGGVCMLLVFLIRMLATKYRWNLPKVGKKKDPS